MRITAVLAQTSGFAAIASILLAMKSAPSLGRCDGCSDVALVQMTQDTVGRRSVIASLSNANSERAVRPSTASADPRRDRRNAANCSSTLQPNVSSCW